MQKKRQDVQRMCDEDRMIKGKTERSGLKDEKAKRETQSDSMWELTHVHVHSNAHTYIYMHRT